MASLRFSPQWFTLVFCLAYGAILALELPVPGYYPLTGRWSFGDFSIVDGTVMHWYGLTFEALILGVLAGVLLPRRLAPRVLGLVALGATWALMAVAAFLLRSYFWG